MTWVTHKDPRYDLPALVFAAVLGTSWIVTLTPRLQALASGVLVAVVAASLLSIGFGVGGATYELRLAPSSASANPIAPFTATLYSTAGWLRGGPPLRNDGNILALLRKLKREGYDEVAVSGESLASFNAVGVQVLRCRPACALRPTRDPFGAHEVTLAAEQPAAGSPRPCQQIDQADIYVEVASPNAHPRLICP